jgi:hypothetical protein
MELIDNFTDYSSKNLDFDKPVEIDFLDDEDNAKNPLGSTAHYNPDEMKITIYVTGRHLKDILRSISHELIHHVQNCRGDLDHGINKLGYAQDDKHMRGMEHEAYTMGNIMNFRDFEDNYKRGKKMSINESKLKKQLKKLINEEIDNLEEQTTEPVGDTVLTLTLPMTLPFMAVAELAGTNPSDEKAIQELAKGFKGRSIKGIAKSLRKVLRADLYGYGGTFTNIEDKGNNLAKMFNKIADDCGLSIAFVKSYYEAVGNTAAAKAIEEIGKVPKGLMSDFSKGLYKDLRRFDFSSRTVLRSALTRVWKKAIKCPSQKKPKPSPPGGGGQPVDILELPCYDKCPPGSMRVGKVKGAPSYLKGVCVDVVDRTPIAILRKGNENLSACRKGGGGKKRSKRCPRKITIQIQKKLNELGYKLKPTRRAPDGVDGVFGKDTYNNLVKALGKNVVGRNRFVASRNCKKLLGLLQKTKPNPSPTPSPTPDEGLGYEPGTLKIGPMVDKLVRAKINPELAKITDAALQLKNDGKLTSEVQTNTRRIMIALRALRTQLRSVAMNTIRKERNNLMMPDGKFYSKNKVNSRASQLVNQLFTPFVGASNKLADVAFAQQLESELKKLERAAGIRENIKSNFDILTEDLREHKIKKQDQSFKKLVEGIKK